MADVNHPWVGAPKPRSSPAPFIPLGKAIDRARQLYEAVRHHPAPMKAVVQKGYGTADVLHVEEVEKPVVTDDRVLIRVRAASLLAGGTAVATGSPQSLGATLLARSR